VSFHADVKGLREARETLQAMRTRAHDLTPAWQELITWWAATNVEQFASRGRRWRTPWAPLRPTTLAQKRRQGFMSDPLARTTRMREELTRRPLGAEHITHDQMDVGTDLPYAKFHQRGAPRAHLPRRPLVNARAVAAEGTAGSVVLTWIVDGVPNIGGHNTKLER
jgi:phage gpG-like protein